MPELGDIGETSVDPGRWSFGFNGQYRHSLDEKGRLSVPVNFRRDAAGNAIARFKLPGEYWKAVVEPQLLQLPIMEREARLVTRMLLSRAADCEPDRQGRIMVPAPLREFADVGNEAIVNGMYNRVEIWGVEKWFAYEAEAVGAFEDMAARYRIKF
jgi:MraZ protein